jgi:hypothetical protein
MSSEIQGLEAFVKEALLQASKEEIEKVLLGAGWPPEQVTP